MKQARPASVVVKQSPAPRPARAPADPLTDSRALMGALAARYTEAEVEAVKAVAAGNASPGQQKLALDWIIHKAARTYDEPFLPGHGDMSVHLGGRRNVGLQIVKLINVPVKKLVPSKPLSTKEP
jgi:hypothetical protein